MQTYWFAHACPSQILMISPQHPSRFWLNYVHHKYYKVLGLITFWTSSINITRKMSSPEIHLKKITIVGILTWITWISCEKNSGVRKYFACVHRMLCAVRVHFVPHTLFTNLWCYCYQTAVDVLEGLLDEDDEVPQVWYMIGWANYLQGPDYKENTRYYLQQCKQVSMATGHHIATCSSLSCTRNCLTPTRYIHQ